MEKDVLFLCQYFYPENNSSATLPFDTAKYLASQGYKVGAMVGYPKEYADDTNCPLSECVDGVQINRLRYLQLNRVGKISRLINFFSLTARMLISAERLQEYKVCIVYSNPPILPVVAIRGKRKYNTKIVFVAYDVYPEIAYASNALSSKGIISRIMIMINRKLYSSVDHVVALTDEMKEFLLAHRKELNKDCITAIPNWAHEGSIDSSAGMYKKFGYEEGQFIVSYFGNMGTCQDMETLMNAAVALKDDKDIHFLIVGHGNKKEAVRKCIKDNNLSNVQLIDFLTGDDYEQALAISSCFVVSLEKGLKGMCAPSKYYSYLQGGKPVLAVVEKDSFLHKEVNEERIGSATQIGDVEDLKAEIVKLWKDEEYRKEAGIRALSLYKEKYSKEKAMDKYSTLFSKLLR